MTRTRAKTKSLTRSRRSQSTRRSSASTRTSRTLPPKTLPSHARHSRAHKLAAELLSRQLRSSPGKALHEAVVEGVSMWPRLRPGYRIRYRAIPVDSLSPGDLIVIRGSGRRGESHLRVHRLIGRVGPYFVEAGDNAFSASLVRPEDILGKVENVLDWKGKRVKLPRLQQFDGRFRYFLWCAHGFMFAHECKDRLLGGRRSLVLWRLSQAYRAGLGTFGLQVPALQPL